ncbi:hypothetical protein Tsubulata_004267 [Turnera subulata]|uniref:Uncharacterized protein n=1 Tax=Turnera subulata TaxID=218843 RepID=A0A9Q0JEZ8_9ROSI|nr:hypothetical protein Tsubulata_004267 [Turnera subulata]
MSLRDRRKAQNEGNTWVIVTGFNKKTMETETHDGILPVCRVKATLKLGPEVYSLSSGQGSKVSEQLVSVKEQSMSILKEFITKHNVPNDVPDELVESASEDDDPTPEKPQAKSKKKRLT